MGNPLATSNCVATHWNPATVWKPTGNQQLCGNPIGTSTYVPTYNQQLSDNPMATSNYVATQWQPAPMWQPTSNQDQCGNLLATSN